MGHPTGRVDIPGLIRAGAAVEAAAAGFVAPREALAPAGALPGWSSGAGLSAAGTAWTAFLGALGTQVRTFGADLTRAAKDYQAADAEAAHRVGAAGGRQLFR